MKNHDAKLLPVAVLAIGLLGIAFGPAQADVLTNNNYHAYSNTAQGADTISPFAGIFGSITEQDPNGDAGETTQPGMYDFRGLTSVPAAGQTYFFLEDIHDGQFDVPGATMTASQNVRTNNGRNGSDNASGNCDNIDEDDGSCDGLIGYPRGAMRGPTRFDFDVGVLGDLPTHVGIALCGDHTYVTINAYDSGGTLLETATAYTYYGGKAFAGVITTEGVAYVTIAGGTESDHFQYGRIGEGDTTPPSLAAVDPLSPSNTETDVFVDANLVVRFDEDVQKGSGNIVIKKLADNSVVETIDVTSGRVTINGFAVTINPSNDLAYTTGYYVEIASGAIKDMVNLDFSGISGSATWSFTTKDPDLTPPAVSTLSPTNGETDVGVYLGSLVVDFNEDVQKGTGNIIIKKLADNSVVETIDVTSGSVTIDGPKITIPLGSYYLEGGSGYFVELDNGAIEDLFGNAFTGFSGSSTWGFTTASKIYLPPTTYHAYSNTNQGANTISPFASIFGPIAEQDPDGGVGETTSLYDFRGLTAAPVAGKAYFFLEDVQDGQIDMPGVTVNGLTARTDDGRNGSQSSGYNADSVDEDDGACDGAYGLPRSGFRTSGGEIRFTFDDGVLGGLPTHVGIVFADNNSINFKAYDSDDALVAEAILVSAFADPFVGAIHEGGIAYVIISSGAEYDHFQYGLFSPPPAGMILIVR